MFTQQFAGTVPQVHSVHSDLCQHFAVWGPQVPVFLIPLFMSHQSMTLPRSALGPNTSIWRPARPLSLRGVLLDMEAILGSEGRDLPGKGVIFRDGITTEEGSAGAASQPSSQDRQRPGCVQGASLP